MIGELSLLLTNVTALMISVSPSYLWHHRYIGTFVGYYNITCAATVARDQRPSCRRVNPLAILSR